MNAKQMTEYLDSLESHGIPSVDCIVFENHELIYRHRNGECKESTLYLMFSMTKVLTMTAMMQLVEQGKVDLEDPVSRFLPAYGKLSVNRDGRIEKIESPMLIKHLLSMQSGLDYNLERPGIMRVLRERGQQATTREIVDSFVESPLIFAPGEHFEYSLSHDVAAAVIEVVSGMKFSEYLKRNIWTPLHMERTFFAKPMNDDVADLAQQYIVNEQGKIEKMPSSCNYQFTVSYESGGAGLISCTEDYAKFADTMACGGVSTEGVRILQAATIERMKQNLLGETGKKDIVTKMGRRGYGYGCGVQVLLEPELIGAKAPAGVFGWDGAAGSCIIMDTASKRSLVYTQHVRNCGMAYDTIHPRLRDLLFS